MRGLGKQDVNVIAAKKTISEIIKNDHGKPATTDKTNL